MSVDLNAFPPELPPEPRPDTDDVGGDELDRAEQAPRSVGEALAAADRADWPTDWKGRPVPACDYCGAPSSLGAVYLADGEREHACYPCHATMIAQALNVAADAEAAGEQVEAPA